MQITNNTLEHPPVPPPRIPSEKLEENKSINIDINTFAYVLDDDLAEFVKANNINMYSPNSQRIQHHQQQQQQQYQMHQLNPTSLMPLAQQQYYQKFQQQRLQQQQQQKIPQQQFRLQRLRSDDQHEYFTEDEEFDVPFLV